MAGIAVSEDELSPKSLTVDESELSSPPDPTKSKKLASPEAFAASHDRAVQDLHTLLDKGLPGVARPPTPEGLPTNPPGKTGPMIGATEPGLLERARAVVMGSGRSGDTAIGRAFGETHEGPAQGHTETAGLPLLRPSEVTPEITQAVGGLVPGAGLVTNTAIGKGVVAGGTKFAEGMTTAPNLLMLAGGEGLGLLGKVHALLPKAVSAYFSADMLSKLYQQAPELKKAWDKGNPEEIATAFTEAAATLGMAGMAGYHAIKGTGTEIAGALGKRPPSVERATESTRQGAEAIDGPTTLAVSPEELSPVSGASQASGRGGTSPKRGAPEPDTPEAGHSNGTSAGTSNVSRETPQSQSTKPSDEIATPAESTPTNGIGPSVKIENGAVTIHQEDGKPFVRLPLTDRHSLIQLADTLREAGHEQAAKQVEDAAPDHGQTIAHELPYEDTLKPRIAETLAAGSTRVTSDGRTDTLQDDGSWNTDERRKFERPAETLLNDEFIRKQNALRREEAINTPPIVGRGTISPVKPKAVEEAELEPASPKLWEMSPEELDAAHAEAKGRDKQDLVDLFGENGAKEYSRLEKTANSSTRTDAETTAAQDALDAMQAKLTEPQRNRLFGIGDERPQADDIAAHRLALGRLDFSSPEALGESLKWAVTGIGEKQPEDMTGPERVRYNQLRYGMWEGARLGFDPETVSAAALRGAAGRFGAAAPDMLERFARGGTERPIEQPAIGASNEGGKRVVEPLSTSSMKPTDINLDPARFQFKRDVGAKGVSDQFKDTKAFDKSLAGAVAVWTDPADGKTYAVNGHHRVELAQRTNAPDMNVLHLDAKNAQDARTQGAIINISEGQGTPIDAAKVFRDSGMDAAALERKNINIKGKLARQGLALANLDPELFKKVVQGDMTADRGAILGEHLSHEDQRQLYDTVEKGKHVSDAQLSEMIWLAKGDTPKATEKQVDLFGEEEVTRSLIREKAEVSDYVRKRLGQEKKLFAAVGNEGAAERLAVSGNIIKAGENAKVAEQAAQAGEIYDKLARAPGKISDALNSAASLLANGENSAATKERAYKQIREALVEAADRFSGKVSAPAGSAAEDAGVGSPGSQPGARGQEAEPLAKSPEKKQAESVPRESRETPGTPRLPPALAGAKPRYAFGPNQFELKFANDLDKAAYITAQATRSKQDAGYLKFVMDHTGLGTGQVRLEGARVRAMIKSLASRMEKGGILEVPSRVVAKLKKLGSDTAGSLGRQKGGGLFDEPTEQKLSADAERDKAKLEGDRLSAQFKAPVSRDEQVKKLKKGEQPAQTSMFEKTPENPQGSLFGSLHSAARNLFDDESGSVDKNLASLGTKKFIEKDVIPTARRVAGDLAEARDQALRLFAPTARDSAAELTGLSMRQRMAQFERRYAQGQQRLRDAEKFFNARTPADNYRFIDNVEKGLGRSDNPLNVSNRDFYQPGDKELEPIAKILTRMLDKRKAEVQALGEGALDRFYTNYFPHLFERPTAATEYVNKFFGDKGRLEGPASFLKRRDFPTFKEALAAGLKPVSDNPIQLVMLKAREMDRYLLAHHTLRDLGDRGIAVRVPARGEEVPERLERYTVPTKEDVPPGYAEVANLMGGAKWYAEEGAAQVLNNYLTPGLRQTSGGYRILAGINNVMNQANLGLSAFHLTGEIIRSGVSRAALGIEDVFNGKPIRGSIRIATFPAGPFVDYLQGSKVLREYFKPGSEGAPIAGITDGLMKGGGRAVEPDEFTNHAVKGFVKALHEGNVIGAGLRLPLAALEKLSQPLMTHLIPRLKLGVFAGMAANDIEKLGPGASVEETQRAMAKAWDATDDRMGQMVYDNLFWNKTVKDAMHLMVRSVGWNLGSLRGHVGGVLDAKDLVTRKPGAEFSHRIAWNMALPLVSAIIGATYQYAHTGQGPQKVKDYFFPKREDGTRVSMPTDVKDIYHWSTDPVRTAEDKTGPLISTLVELLHNRDYYNRPIVDTGDPYFEQGKEFLEFLGRQMAPFTLQQYLGGKKAIPEPNMEHKVEGILGVTKASKDLQREGPPPKRVKR